MGRHGRQWGRGSTERSLHVIRKPPASLTFQFCLCQCVSSPFPSFPFLFSCSLSFSWSSLLGSSGFLSKFLLTLPSFLYPLPDHQGETGTSLSLCLSSPVFCLCLCLGFCAFQSLALLPFHVVLFSSCRNHCKIPGDPLCPSGISSPVAAGLACP